jgi:MFS family permease
MTEAAFAASVNALLAEKAGASSRTSAFSLYSFLSNMAWGIGGFAIPVVLVFQSLGLGSGESHVVLFVAVAALSIAITPLLLRIGESRTSKSAKSIGQFLPRKSKNTLMKYATTSILIAFGAGLFVPVMALWFGLAYGVSDVVSGPLLGTSSFLIAATTLMAPYLARRIGLVRAIVVTQLFSTVFMVAVPLSPTFAIAGVIYTVRSFLMNVSNPLQSSMIMGLVSEDERGAASGLNAAIWRFPNSISTGFGASMMGAGLLALPFYLAAVLYVVSISLFWLFFHGARLPEERTEVAV